MALSAGPNITVPILVIQNIYKNLNLKNEVGITIKSKETSSQLEPVKINESYRGFSLRLFTFLLSSCISIITCAPKWKLPVNYVVLHDHVIKVHYR